MDFGAGEFIDRPPRAPAASRHTALSGAGALRRRRARTSRPTSTPPASCCSTWSPTATRSAAARSTALVDAHSRGERRRSGTRRPTSRLLRRRRRTRHRSGPERSGSRLPAISTRRSAEIEITLTAPRETGLNVGRTLRIALVIAAMLAATEVLGVISSEPSRWPFAWIATLRPVRSILLTGHLRAVRVRVLMGGSSEPR